MDRIIFMSLEPWHSFLHRHSWCQLSAFPQCGVTLGANWDSGLGREARTEVVWGLYPVGQAGPRVVSGDPHKGDNT